MKWNIRFLRVAMWLFRLLTLLALIFAVASFFVFIGFVPAQFTSSGFRIAQWSTPIGSETFLTNVLLVRILPAFIFALIFASLAALIQLNLRFYAALRNRR